MEDVKINLLLAVHDELQKLKHVMMNEFKQMRQILSRPLKITETIKINDHEDLAVLGCSSFASSPRNKKLSEEPIDLSHDQAIIAQIWIRHAVQKTYVSSISAPTHPNHSHELLTSTSKKLNAEQPVPGRPPPLRDKKFVQFAPRKAMKIHRRFHVLCPTLRTRLFGGWSIDKIIT